MCIYVHIYIHFFQFFFWGGACVFSFIRLNFPGIFPFIQKIKVPTFLASMDISLKYLTWFFNAKLCVFKTLLLFLALLIENIQLRMSALFLKLDSMCFDFVGIFFFISLNLNREEKFWSCAGKNTSKSLVLPMLHFKKSCILTPVPWCNIYKSH